MGRKLTRQDWITAALGEMSRRGVDGVSVEPLAKAVGATKGSFYWHFRDREELVTEALARWEHEGTDAVIAALSPLGDARTRLRQLLEALFVPGAGATAVGDDDRPAGLRANPAAKTLDLSISLSGSAGHPAVAEVLARVTARRVTFVAEQIEACGVEGDEARRRALLAYTSYLGYSSLGRTAPGAMPGPEEAGLLVNSMVELLTRAESQQ
jgi:AcrR family transcriptional regulator